ncbi:TlpA disulfide reductase family protein [Aequorivita echinoideorum]|uniref:Redoxin domain-containing protein n=1 Tax=Aequorivita echinoideorum TaxID=1549647 RepID=A0ABS5S2I3_9FLAO|nr:TlpA disulfide reductase family protein [Aequorivita echinoideorum]MBT0607411.1 redoxin domain-containing protein [Aequorivita echinoideorum]
MKLLPIILFILLFQSCADNKSEAKMNLETSEVAMKNLQNNDESFISKKVVSLNFEQLQKKYFQKNNDSIYVINFWATWCKPCIKELPAFEKIASEYADKRVKILLVSLDFPDKIDSQVIPFINKNNIKSEVVLLDDADANSWIPKVSTQWSGAIPATIIYKNDARKFYEQSFTFEELETELKTFIKK